eukprot:gene12277-biopygen6649
MGLLLMSFEPRFVLEFLGAVRRLKWKTRPHDPGCSLCNWKNDAGIVHRHREDTKGHAATRDGHALAATRKAMSAVAKGDDNSGNSTK